MANATGRLGFGAVDVIAAQGEQESVETLSAATRFYANAMIGVDATGYLCKGDDTQAWAFAGLAKGKEPNAGGTLLPAGTAGDGTINLDIHRPPLFEMTLTSVAVTDKGKKVYALFDNAVTLDASATTYANLVGTVEKKIAANIALVRACYDGVMGNGRLSAAKVLAATGAQTLSKMDLNKTILIPSTGAYAITLPPVADTQAGDWIRFVKTTSNAVAATITGNASENIDGANTYAAIDAQWDSALLVSYGTAWAIASRDIA